MDTSIIAPSLRGKRIIVTGGARGIGAAAVRTLVKQGAKIVIFDIRDELAEAVVHKISQSHPSPDATAPPVTYVHVDVSSQARVNEGVSKAVEILGGLDGLFHAAGIERQAPPEDMISEADIDALLSVNVKGTILINQAIFQHLKKNEHGGTIVNLGSDEGLDPCAWLAGYATTKGAVHSYVRAVSKGWAKYNIRVNSLLPVMRTEMFDEYWAGLSPSEREAVDSRLAERVLLGGKLGELDRDLAPVIAFLMSDASRFMTGQLISVNGGMVQTR
ncbi:hypothetical protein N7490_003660 [Penicillium lividum]|nr:hypothetical protein N7490_003660 [Penicillium lividum]